jgi:hypothetical protein
MSIQAIDDFIDSSLDTMHKLVTSGKARVKHVVAGGVTSALTGQRLHKLEASIGKRYTSMVLGVCERILSFYVIMMEAAMARREPPTFAKQLVELQRDVPELLPPEDVARLIKAYHLYTQIASILRSLPAFKSGKRKLDRSYQEALDFINGFQDDKFLLDKHHGTHNVVKALLITHVYVDGARERILGALEDDSLKHAETKTIEIIDSTTDEIDYAAIEALFSPAELRDGMAEVVYRLVQEAEVDGRDHLSVDAKIDHLFRKKIIIPITDEFLRYHRSTEKYETNDASLRKSKKIDKIRFIVSTLNQVADLYSKSTKDKRKEVEKHFYQPLATRKVVLFNDTEESNSINKLVNMGLTAMRSNEFFQDLVSYRSYAYVNFNDFKDFGFPIRVSAPVTAIRYSNFEFKKESHVYNGAIEWRVISPDTKAHIVGIAIPKRSPLVREAQPTMFQCIRVRNTMNLKKLFDNPYQVVVKKLSDMLLQDARYGKLGYWLFDRKYDKLRIHEYDEINQLGFEDFYRYVVSTLYDHLVGITHQKIYAEVLNHEGLGLDAAHAISEHFQGRLVEIDDDTEYGSQLAKDLVEVSRVKGAIGHDETEDLIPGVNTPLIKLPTYAKDAKQLVRIRVTDDDARADPTANPIYGSAICQHFVSWKKLMGFQRRDPNRFNQLLFEFKNRYVMLSVEGEFVCRSCFQPVDIKKYAYDWTSDTEEGIALSFSLASQLENIAEYEKYNRSIKNMDKIIERVALGANMLIYLGNLPQIKVRRQEIIKGVIDLILVQNQTLRSNNPNERKERVERAGKLYGVSKEHTQFFLFELKNDIFTYSSKDTDKFKRPKLNNVMVYVILLLINELTTSQIMFLVEDKTINVSTFDKHFAALFADLYIRINNSNDVVPIRQYPTLCYTIYVLAGVLVKYKLWFSAANATASKFDLATYRGIVHTYVDLLNSILEVNTQPDKNYQYEVFATKFFVQLNRVYASRDLLDKIRASKTHKGQDPQARKVRTESTAPDIPLTGTLDKPLFFGETEVYLRPALRFLLKPSKAQVRVSIPSSFHDGLLQQTLDKLATLYNLDGSKRIADAGVRVERANKDKLMKMYENIRERRAAASAKAEKRRTTFLQGVQERLAEQKQGADQLVKSDDAYQQVVAFVRFLESISSPTIEMFDGTNNLTIHTEKNVYVIDHTPTGKPLATPIEVVEGSKKLVLKKNDPLFKTNVYVYHDGSTTMIYHATHLYLLGYRNANGKVVRTEDTVARLKLRHSLKNMLLFLGHESMHYPLGERSVREVVSDALRVRINHLKNILTSFQRIIHQVRNKFEGSTQDPIAKVHASKFKELKVGEGDIKAFQGLNTYARAVYFTPIDRDTVIQEDDGYVYVGNLGKASSGNGDAKLVAYLCQELTVLLKANANSKFTQSNLVFLIAHVIHSEFHRCMLRSEMQANFEVRKFALVKSDQTVVYKSDTDLLDVIETETVDREEADGGLDVDIDQEDIDAEETTFYNIDD